MRAVTAAADAALVQGKRKSIQGCADLIANQQGIDLAFPREEENDMADLLWDDEDLYWRDNYSTRPYASGRDYEVLRPGYRYGYESATRYAGRKWNEVEQDLERGWDHYSQRGSSTWQQVKDAARDAWDRVTGRK